MLADVYFVWKAQNSAVLQQVGQACRPSRRPLRGRQELIVQPFSQKSLTATVLKVSQIGLCGVAVADLELFCNSWSVGFLGERLYNVICKEASLRIASESQKCTRVSTEKSVPSVEQVRELCCIRCPS